MAPKILIAGIGNIFLGDDAFGVEVVRRLAQRVLPAGIRLVDFGIRGFDLAYALMEDYDIAILIDATTRGGEPGTLYTMEPDLSDLDGMQSFTEIQPHGMDPVQVFRLVKTLGGELARMQIWIIGCEPATFGPENEGVMGLSNLVQAAVEEAIKMTESLIRNLVDAKTAAAVPQ